jgi:hypothetical protein
MYTQSELNYHMYVLQKIYLQYFYNMSNLIKFIENNSNFKEFDFLKIYANIAIDVTNCPSNKVDAMNNSLSHLNIKLHFLICQRDSHHIDSKHVIQCEDIIDYCMGNKLNCLISDETLVRLIDTKIDNQIEFYSLNCLKLNESTILNYNGNFIECPAALISRRLDLNSISVALSLHSVQLNQLLQFCNKKNDFNIVNKFNYEFRNILKQKKIIRYSANNQQYVAILIYMISLYMLDILKDNVIFL